MFASKNERKVHYSIRKFSIGVASVAVASLFMGSVVHATEKEVTTQVATSSNKANKSQTEHMKAAKQVDEYIEKMLSEIQLDRRKHTQNVGLLTKLGAIKTEYLRGLSVSKEKSTAELPSEIKEKLTAAFEQFKKDTLKSGKKVAEAQKKAKDQKEAKQEIEALIVKHKGREIDLDRKKAKAAVTEHLKKLLNDIEKNLKKEQHTHTVELIKNLKDIEKTYLHKLDESTQKAQLQKLIAESQSKLDEAFSKFKNGLSSSSNSGSSTKPETPQPETPKPEVKPELETPKPEVKPELETPKPEVKPDNSKPQADDKKPSTPNNLSKDKQSSNQASTNENKKQGPATNKPKKSLPSTGSISNLALEIAGLLTLAGATILAKKRMK
ncbi:TPA: RICH domain-containing protein [Streptococcus pneumoniae]|uniref:RICH domain-containing protein n=1 Tax=Streptococcus pneumoniae TaxID=1313 RepID=UPI000766768F|nr:RICH domain-containing protein [Streptococcus pneumoniae]OKQ51315.1 hypothetical protein BH611_00905 [Streptococcus pneumoniae]CWF19514.1 choline binding protein A [Streptococcus pneumoniae]